MTTTKPLAFYHSRRMPWWPITTRRPIVDEVMIGDYTEDSSGDLGEFEIRWFDFDEHRPPCPQIAVFSDAWGALGHPQGQQLVQWLIENHREHPTAEEVCAFLLSIGLIDHSESDAIALNYVETHLGDTVRALRECEDASTLAKVRAALALADRRSL